MKNKNYMSSSLSMPATGAIIPVSYTHLDVYKRQEDLALLEEAEKTEKEEKAKKEKEEKEKAEKKK